ncbi:MAG: 23S rRNA (pseudouridine(1915)-N(3))-methyltransferase RlmH [Paracoccaceae bacterium]
MKINICAVGRLKSGPERSLIDDYSSRFDRTGRALGLGPLNIIEIEDRNNGGLPVEAALLEKASPAGSILCALDEHGPMISSPEFADKLARWRDFGNAQVTFIIGGADGIHPDLLAKAETKISLGKMVWPHMLARVMLAEQLYRAASILAGKPYHRY